MPRRPAKIFTMAKSFALSSAFRGGGFDTYARTLSRSMGKYIPGNPSVIVENMTGAGSLIAANHIYRVGKADGLTIGAFNGNHILGQLLGASATSFDPRKMEWMGAPGNNHDLCVLNQKDRDR